MRANQRRDVFQAVRILSRRARADVCVCETISYIVFYNRMQAHTYTLSEMSSRPRYQRCDMVGRPVLVTVRACGSLRSR